MAGNADDGDEDDSESAPTSLLGIQADADDSRTIRRVKPVCPTFP